MSELPYVISAELEYADKDTVRPERIETFRRELDQDLRDMGNRTVWVEAAMLRRGMTDLIDSTDLPVISLDQSYIRGSEADDYLGVSRAVNRDFSDAGYDGRLGFVPFLDQLDALGRKFNGQEVVLVDDVLFSGEMITNLQRKLDIRGVQVAALICGVAIGEGADKLITQGIETESVVAFDEVKDQLCERDFVAMEGSGRKIYGQQQSALYFDSEFGKPEEWASLADSLPTFCVNSLLRSRQLLRANKPFPTFVGYGEGLTGEVLKRAIAERKMT